MTTPSTTRSEFLEGRADTALSAHATSCFAPFATLKFRAKNRASTAVSKARARITGVASALSRIATGALGTVIKD